MKEEKKVRHYHHGRIKQILRDDYNCRLENIHQGYKASRYHGYSEKYNLIDNATGEVIQTNVRLHGLRVIFTEEGYPLQPEQNKRNQGAKDFLETVNKLSQSK